MQHRVQLDCADLRLQLSLRPHNIFFVYFVCAQLYENGY